MSWPRSKNLALCAALVLWASVSADAAYNAAQIQINEPVPNQPGSYRLVVAFAGNAGEPVVKREIIVTGSTTANSLRQWAIDTAADLNATRTLATSGALQPGQTVNLAAINIPPPTDFEIWRAKVNKLVRLKALGLTNATAVSEINALQSDVNATYVAGYAAQY